MLDDEDAGAEAMTDVKIVVNGKDAVTAINNKDAVTTAVNNANMDASVAIGLMATTAIPPTTAPTTVTISWAMPTNDDNDNAHNGDASQDVSSATDGGNNDGDNHSDDDCNNSINNDGHKGWER